MVIFFLWVVLLGFKEVISFVMLSNFFCVVSVLLVEVDFFKRLM